MLLLAAFYAVYLGKLLMQKRKGIQTDQMARGKQKGWVYYTELLLKIATYCVVLVQVVCVAVVEPVLPAGVIIAGLVLGILGVLIFAAAVVTMKDSWRAGLAQGDQRELVTSGIYQISRNPAFLGFDCVYLGLLLMFFHWVLLLFSLFAAIMLHLQILQEEAYLPSVFGKAYLDYRSQVCRYFGRKHIKLAGPNSRA